MNINIIPISMKHMSDVIDILQLISEFKPKKLFHENIYKEFIKHTDNYGLVAVDENEKVLGYGSILFEYKIRGGIIGHIEDIAVHHQYQKRGVGNLILNKLIEMGKNKECYKITLSCKKKNILFYEKCNFSEGGLTMKKFI